MSRGRPENKDKIDLEELFAKYEEKIVENGRIVFPQSEVWSFIRTTHSIDKKEKTIYTAAQRWLKQTQKQADCEQENLLQSENDISIETSMECTDKSSSHEEFNSPKCLADTLKFYVQFSSKQWNTIKPVEKSYARNQKGSKKTGVRKYQTLQSGLWTDLFSKEIAKRRDVPCEFAFINNKVYSTGETFIKIQGKCSLCKSHLVAVIKDEPEEDEPVKVLVKIYGIEARRHSKKIAKVKVTSKIAEKLYAQKKPATVVRRNLLKKSAQMFRAPTGRIMSANAVRCGQYRQRKKQKLDSCPFTALTYLKSSNKYKNCIQRINYDPLAVFYATPEQIKLYQEYKKRNPITTVSCDATGGLTHKLGMFTILSKLYFQYEKNQNLFIPFFLKKQQQCSTTRKSSIRPYIFVFHSNIRRFPSIGEFIAF